MNNQLDFTFFKKTNAAEVIAGKDDYLFEETYIQSYNGTDFIGKQLIDNQILKMHFVQKELARMNKQLIIVIAPNKARYYSDKIPTRYAKESSETNYSYFKKRLTDLDLNVIDFNSYFKSAKDTSRIPLISKFSIHWSQYGATIAADSINKFVESLTSKQLCGIKYTISVNQTAKDQEILDAMNLIWDINYPPQIIPSIQFSNNNCKLRYMGTGDSFYKNFFYLNIPQTIWNQSNFRYYNRIYCTGYNETENIENKDIMDDVKSADIIVLLASEVNLWRFPFGFIDQLYFEFAPVTHDALVKHYTALENDSLSTGKLIKSDFEFASLIKLMSSKQEYDSTLEALSINVYKKRLRNIDFLLHQEINKKQPEDSNLWEVITRDANWLYKSEKIERLIQVQSLVDTILSRPDLMELAKAKAIERNQPLDEVIKGDAKWIYNQKR